MDESKGTPKKLIAKDGRWIEKSNELLMSLDKQSDDSIRQKRRLKKRKELSKQIKKKSRILE